MTNYERYNGAFVEAFGVNHETLANLKYQDISQWDSVGHMNLMSMLEEAFDIMLDTDDIIDFNSYETGKKMLEKYEVIIE